MYCKECGKEVLPNASVCLGCGVKVGEGSGYCPNCGESVSKNASVCVKCGANVKRMSSDGTAKSKTTAAILAFVLGGLGAHNFYLGFTGKAVAQLVLSFFFGLGWIWSIADGIGILMGKIDRDAKGNPLE